MVSDIIGSIPFDGPDFGDFDYPDFSPPGRVYRNNRGNYNGNARYGRPTGVQAPKNVAPKPKITPVDNQSFTLSTYVLTPQDLAETLQGIRDDNKAAISTYAMLIPKDSALTQQVENSMIEQTQQAQVLAATQSGDADQLLELFQDPFTGGTPAELESMLSQAKARQALKAVLTHTNDGTLDEALLQDLKTAITPFLPVLGDKPTEASLIKADELVNTLLINSNMLRTLQAAEPGTTAIPLGSQATIIISDLVQPGIVIPLGSNSAIVGSTNPAEGTYQTTGRVMHAAGIPVGIGEPVAEATKTEIPDGVFLTNAANSPVSYVLNGKHEFTMQANHTQQLHNRSAWTIVFDRGESHGQARYQLDGSYRFELTDQGWELFRTTFDVTIDNTANAVTFNYVLNNKPYTVAAGQSADHSDLAYTPFIRFDNGNQQIKQKSLAEGAYRVLAAQDDLSLELFASETPGGAELVAPRGLKQAEPLRLFTAQATTGDDADLFGPSSEALPEPQAEKEDPTEDLFQ